MVHTRVSFGSADIPILWHTKLMSCSGLSILEVSSTPAHSNMFWCYGFSPYTPFKLNKFIIYWEDANPPGQTSQDITESWWKAWTLWKPNLWRLRTKGESSTKEPVFNKSQLQLAWWLKQTARLGSGLHLCISILHFLLPVLQSTSCFLEEYDIKPNTFYVQKRKKRDEPKHGGELLLRNANIPYNSLYSL